MSLFRLVWFGIVQIAITSLSSSAQESGEPKSPKSSEAAKALGSFQIKPGFRIELVAAEPMVVAPVAMAFDEDGRLFVAEMRDYPDRREENPHLGRIRLLEDTDGDGVFDASTVYADNLAWPSAVGRYGGGSFLWEGGGSVFFVNIH